VLDLAEDGLAMGGVLLAQTDAKSGQNVQDGIKSIDSILKFNSIQIIINNECFI
jgi:hypothetical protein